VLTSCDCGGMFWAVTLGDHCWDRAHQEVVVVLAVGGEGRAFAESLIEYQSLAAPLGGHGRDT